MLTPLQDKLWRFIAHRMANNGIAPTFDEMRVAMGLRSKSGVVPLISSLDERGFLRRLPNKARAIELLRWPNEPEAPLCVVKVLPDGSVNAWFDAARLKPMPYAQGSKILADIVSAFVEQMGIVQ